MRAVSGAALLLLVAGAIASPQEAKSGPHAAAVATTAADPEIKVMVDDAEREHGIIVDHLTNSILGLAGHTSASMSAEERAQLALAAEPIFLQLEHAVRSHVELLERARAKHAAKMSAASHSMVSSASARASGIFMGNSVSPTSCFACVYLMQRVMAETEPYYSPAVHAGTAAALSEAARSKGSGARGVPVEHPLQSAYQSRNLPINNPDPENGIPLMQPNSGMNGWAPITSPLLFHGGASHPVSNALDQFPDREAAEHDNWDANKVAESMRIPELDKELWPHLHEADDDESGEEEEDEEEEEPSLLQVRTDGPVRWEHDAPVEAYVQWNDPPRIGPRFKPPIPPFMGKAGSLPMAPPYDSSQGPLSAYRQFATEQPGSDCRAPLPAGVMAPEIPGGNTMPCVSLVTPRQRRLEEALLPASAQTSMVTSEPALGGPAVTSDSILPLNPSNEPPTFPGAMHNLAVLMQTQAAPASATAETAATPQGEIACLLASLL